MFLDNNNKLMIDTDGYILIPFEIPPLEFEFTGNVFPNSNRNASSQIISSAPNTIYIDFGDGSSTYSATMSNNYTFPLNIHTYTDGLTSHIVKIWFQDPTKITTFNFNTFNFYGSFPEAVGYYKLNSLSFTGTFFSDFESKFKGGYFNQVILRSFTLIPLNNITKSLYSSRILTLRISGTDYSNVSTNNIDKLILTKDLNTLIFESNNINNSSLPSNLKNFSTLRVLSMGDNPLTSIPSQINDCKQITELGIGFRNATASANLLFTTWGLGIANMTELISFYFVGQGTSAQVGTIEATLPTGAETCVKLKIINLSSSYKNLTRINALVDDIYSKIPLVASMTIGNTIMRQVSLVLGQIAATLGRNTRPSGTYQAPSGFVLGSNNGTPASEMEMIYVLVNQYKWTVTVTNTAGTGDQLFTS